MGTNKMRDISREQFESFARDVLDWSDDEFRLASDGKSYYWGSTGEAWVFWQASRQAVVVELPSFEGYKDHIVRELQAAFTGAIERQGLKVAP